MMESSLKTLIAGATPTLVLTGMLVGCGDNVAPATQASTQPATKPARPATTDATSQPATQPMPVPTVVGIRG